MVNTYPGVVPASIPAPRPINVPPGVGGHPRSVTARPWPLRYIDEAMDPVLSTYPLGFQWKTPDPFLFCVHHEDHYPGGNADLGPAASLADRDLGQDFEGKDGWRMYHGSVVPGFPQHPHRGFETVTIVRQGLCDHSDSLGAAARFGGGDVQWVTAGAGIVHSEMFPLLDAKGPNTLELFQIWLNLPASDKLVLPHFKMLWREQIPSLQGRDEHGKGMRVSVIAGSLSGLEGLPPPPHSWASRRDANVAIWLVSLEDGARWTLPPSAAPRTLFFFRGQNLKVADRTVPAKTAVALRPEAGVALEAAGGPAEALLLQGRPIAEPVAQYGPFVMNSPDEIQRAFADYRRTQFGGWPWPKDDPTHPATEGRFARHADGRVERPAR
jgi:redox-sensitive bicupin YhaK (pirin superfamily)